MKSSTLPNDKKRIFFFAFLLFLAFSANADPVGAVRARMVAKNFLNNNNARSTGLRDLTAEAGFANLYVFSTESSFVLVAADDCMQPVLGYSLNGSFDLENMPENAAAWFQEYSDAIQYHIDHQTRATSEVLQQWNDLAAGRPEAGRATTAVAPLLTTKWDQGEPYNLLCPSSSVTGCVATAMAQVMKYWEYPSHGIGSHSYTHSNYGVLSADYQNTTYDWDNMLPYYGYYIENGTYHSASNGTTEERTAVATLMYHCGVSVNMEYSPSSSGAVTAYVADALKNYFNYSSQTQHLARADYDDATWINMLKADLNLNRPIQYHGRGTGGHSFVFDGYNSNNYFHVNWGWRGYQDGYYAINGMSPGTGGTGSGSGTYNNDQGAIFGIHPSDCTAATPANLTYTQSGRNITLSWTAGSGAASYNIYCNNNLVGNTTSTTYTHAAPYGTSSYCVRSMDSAGELSLTSNAVSVTVDYPIPVVTDLQATPMGNSVNLSWTAPDWCYPSTPTATLSYGEGSVYYSWGTTCYGHRYPASDLGQYANKAVYKVSTYIQYPGDYTVYIYTNTNTNNKPLASSLAASKAVSCSDSHLWLDIELDEPVILSGANDLWVIMKQENTGQTYPAPSFNLDSYNANACYVGSSPTGVSSLTDYNVAFLIRTYISDGVYTYDLYRNDSNIATNLSNTTYIDSNLAAGAYNYYLKTNYYAGQSPASNTASATIGSGTYYTITATANPAEGGTVTGASSYLQGSTCTLTATPAAGYDFVNWTKNGTQVSTNATYSFIVNEAGSYVANFAQAPSCGIVFNLVDSWGDGWNGNYLVVSYGSTTEQLTIETGSSATYTLDIPEGSHVTLSWITGNYTSECSFTVEYSNGNVIYTGSDISSGFSYEFDVNCSGSTHTASLASGWNWWSTYIEQSDINGLEMLENSLGTAGIRIQARNQYTDYYGTYGVWYGNLTAINNEQSYRIRTNAACTAVITGQEAQPASHPITINGNGWTWIGYPSSQSTSVSNALSGFTAEMYDQIKGRNAYATYYGSNIWYGTMNTLEPGQGYMYKSNASTAKTLVFQTSRNSEIVPNITTEGNYYTPASENYADNMTVTAVINLDGEELRSDAYELAAFVGDECRGSVKLMYVEPIDRYVAFLLVYGDVEEEMNFVLTDGSETLWANTSLSFSANGIVGTGIEPTVLDFGTLGLNDNAPTSVRIYPNPSNGVFNIEGKDIRRIEVINVFGQTVLAEKTASDRIQLDLNGNANGMYLLRVVTDNGIITNQLIKY